MLDMINEFRTGDDAWYWNSDDTTKTTCTGLSELTYDYTLEAVAMQRAAEIALSYSHTRPNSSGCETAVYVYYTWGTDLYARGENIAAGYNSLTTAAAAFEAWQETDEDYSGQGHRRNMLSTSYTAVGIACVTYGDYHFWVQVFGKPTTLNTTATTANDSKTTVNIEVEDASVTSATVSTDTASYDLSCGDSAALPTVTAELTMENTWLSGSSRTVTVVSPTWSSSNTSLVTISDGKLVADSSGNTGSTTITATVFGKTVTASVAVDHGTTELQNAKDATCTEDGYIGDEVCTVCGETVSTGEVIPATGHNWQNPTFTWAEDYSTCSASFTCANDSNHTEVVGCIVDSETEAATCTVAGKTAYTAAVTFDGTEYSDQQTVTIPAKGHSTEIRNAKAATCTEDGYTGEEVCTVCGDTISTGEVISATGHTYVNGICTVCGAEEPTHTHAYTSEVTTEATCTTNGVMTYSCAECGDSYTETIPATGHSTEVQNAKDATCTSDGYTGDEVCTVCGETVSTGETIPATGHNYVNGVCTVCGAEEPGEGEHTHAYTAEVTTKATCTTDGVITYTCECGDSYTEVIPAIGHSTEIQNAKDATCTEDGYTGDEVCTVCGETVSTGETIPATGHNYVNGVCTVCGEKEPGESGGSGWGGWTGWSALSNLLSNMRNHLFTRLSNLFSRFW